MSLDREQFIAGYLAEVDEHLRTANASLLAVDAARGEAGPITHRHVRSLFRALHTIKGLSAMVGVEPVVDISHEMESLLRDADRTSGRLSRAAVDVLIDGVRAIEQRVALFGARKPVPAAPRSLLAALTDLQAPAADGAAGAGADRAPPRLVLDDDIASKVAPLEQQLLVDGARQGRRALRIDFVPSAAQALVGVNITTVRERVSRIAEIVKVLPLAVARTERTPGALAFALLVLSDAVEGELADAASVEPAAVRPLTLVAPAEPRAPASPAFVPDADDGDGDRGEALAADEAEDRVGGAGYVRVDVRRLDDALEKLSALVVTRFRLARAVAALRDRGADVREISSIVADSARELADLRGSIIFARMVSVSELLERVPLIVRGMTRSTADGPEQKLVHVSVHAGRAELDKSVAERVFPAIVHLVRNAVDHAIEPVEVRRSAGKPDEGRITVTAVAHSDSQLELTVEDDGAGVDAERVARRAGRPVPADAAGLLDLLCLPGLSTLEHATSNSGRGMGMDIVHKITVDVLGGELSMSTVPGSGTRFTLRIPLSISICDSFSFECGAQQYVVPVATIEEILEVTRENMHVSPGASQLPTSARRSETQLLRRRGEVLPLFSLARMLALDPSREAQREGERQVRPKALVVRRHGVPYAFAVDRILGQQEIVVRPVDDPLVHVAGVAGTTDLGDGKPTLVLDLVGLVAAVSREAA